MKDFVVRYSEGAIGQQGFATPSDGDYLEGTVTYTVEVDGDVAGPFTSLYKASAGSDRTDPFEAPIPVDYKGPMLYEQFRASVEDYVRRLGFISVGPASRDVLVRDITVEKPWIYVTHDHPEGECGLGPDGTWQR